MRRTGGMGKPSSISACAALEAVRISLICPAKLSKAIGSVDGGDRATATQALVLCLPENQLALLSGRPGAGASKESRNLARTEELIKQKAYGRALTELRGLIRRSSKDTWARTEAERMLGDLEKLAAGRLAEARKKLARGKSEEGLAALRDIVRTFNGFPAANDARTILAQLTNARRAVRDQARRP